MSERLSYRLEVATRGGPVEVKCWPVHGVPGLAVTEGVGAAHGRYHVTHMESGRSMGWPFVLESEAIDAAHHWAPLADWTLPLEAIWALPNVTVIRDTLWPGGYPNPDNIFAAKAAP